MSRSSEQEELLRLIHRCLTDHIHAAEQALALAEEIGENAWTLDLEGFSQLFSFLQRVLADEMTLRITKILEPADVNRPQKRSLDVVLRYIEDNAESLPIENRNRAVTFLVDVAGEQNHEVQKLPDAELARRLTSVIRTKRPKPKSFWFRRDKRIAHAEEVEMPDALRATWDEAEELIEYAQRISALIGEVFGVFYFEANDGTYMLSGDFREIAQSLRSLLERCGLLDSDKEKRVRIEHRKHAAEIGEENGIWVGRVLSAEERIVEVGHSEDDVAEKLRTAIDRYLDRK